MMVFSEKWHTARKSHRCDDCGRTIHPGQRYFAQVNDYDGFSIFKSHEDCHAAVMIVVGYMDMNDCEEWPKVMDFEREDIETVRADAPEIAARLWPDEAPR